MEIMETKLHVLHGLHGGSSYCELERGSVLRMAAPALCYRRGMKLAMGVALGVVFGAALGNVGLGVALGAAFGAAFEGASRRKNRNRQ